MLIVGQAQTLPVKSDLDDDLRDLLDPPIHVGPFSANGEYLAGWDWRSVWVWRVKDGKQMATMKAQDVLCLAVSNDGRWIAAGTSKDKTPLVWDANTYKQVFVLTGAYKQGIEYLERKISGVDFSPDSARLVSTSDNNAAVVWDIATRRHVQILRHDGLQPLAAKYSPHGDQVATATYDSVCVWDSNSGRLLVVIPVEIFPYYNSGLLWFHNHLYCLCYDRIKKFEASTGSALSEWPIQTIDYSSYIALPKHGEFIACSTNSTVTFWDTSTHTQLGLIQLPRDRPFIALSPDGRHLAIGGKTSEITIQSLSHIIVSVVFVWITTYLNMFLAPLFIIGFNSIFSSTVHLPGI